MSWIQKVSVSIEDIPRKKWFLFYLTLMGLSFIFYGSTLSNQYNLDDHFIYTENPKALNGLNKVNDIFKRNSFEGETYNFGYRPITVLSFALENEIFGLNSTVSHFFNVLLYGFLIVLFAIFLKSLFPDKSFLWLGLCCLFFLAMPIHSEMVNNVKSRDELLMLVFGLLATISFLKASKESKLWLIVGLVALSLSILSKKSGIVFLGIIPVSLFFKKGVTIKKGVLLGLIAVLPLLIFRLVKKFIKESKGEINDRTTTLIENPLYDASVEVNHFSFTLEILEFYYKKLSIPFELVSYYGFNTIPFDGFDASNFIVLILTVLLIAMAVIGLKQKMPLSFGLIIMFGGLLPFLNIFFPMVGIVADRFAGLASIGAAVFLVSALSWLAERYFPKNGQTAVPGLIAVFLIYGFTSVQSRNKEWYSKEKLLAADVLKESESATLHALIGKEYLYQIPITKNQMRVSFLAKNAEKHLLQSVSIAPYKVIYTELGNLEFRAKHDLKKAMQYYRKALALDSSYAEPHYHIGWLELGRQNLNEAQKAFKRAVELKPDYTNAYEPLIRLLAESGRYDEALTWNAIGRNRNPNEPRFILNEANIYFIRGEKKKAIEAYQEYLLLSPNDSKVRAKLNQMK